MAGGGKRRITKNKCNDKTNTKPRPRRKPNDRIRDSLFVEGGVLSDFPSFPGRNPNARCPSSSRIGNAVRAKASPASGIGPRKSNGNTFGYVYPTVELQEGLLRELSIAGNNGDNSLDESRPVVLVDSKDTQIVAYLDETPCSKPINVDYAYDYSSSFVLGESLHRGLGFGEESEATLGGIGSSSKWEENYQEGSCLKSSSSDEEMGGDDVYQQKETDAVENINSDLGEETPMLAISAKKNSAYLSIGGMKLFTQDLSDGESDNDDGDDDNSVSSESGESGELSESDGSKDTFDSNSDIDEELAEDYMDGIGGSDNILDAKWLLDNDLDDFDEDTSSSGGFEETVERLGGIALQDASRQYGMKKPQSGNKYPAIKKDGWSSALDDAMLVKDPRTLSAKKNQVARFPQSWPMEARGSKNSRNFPGAKKKHRKEMILAKRCDRMLHRGVDLEKINMKLEQIVINGTDVFSFQPMHSRDCSQVQRLAAIYRLRSGRQGSGKKRFVTVTRTQNTCMPLASDRIRLEKLIGAGNKDADFAVNEVPKTKSASALRNKTRKIGKGSGRSPMEFEARTNSAKKSSNSQNSGASRKHGSRKGFIANQPVSFLSSGVLQNETVEATNVHSKETGETSFVNKVELSSAKVGAFELHTKGFGSKMMAKMGYVEGSGLGKDGQGMAKPIEVVQRPKSLGLGINLSSTSEDLVKDKPQSSENCEKHHKQQSFGAFEKHTKGFGSRMMAKMGFVEGMGLGRDSQGITNPFVAVRLPKSRGLGAKS